MAQGYMRVPLPAICRICKTDIIKDHPRRVHCESCAKEVLRSKKMMYKREHYKKKTIVKLCKLCVTPYVASDEHKVYCCKTCYNKGQRIGRLEKQILQIQSKIFELRGTKK